MTMLHDLAVTSLYALIGREVDGFVAAGLCTEADAVDIVNGCGVEVEQLSARFAELVASAIGKRLQSVEDQLRGESADDDGGEREQTERMPQYDRGEQP